MQVSFSFAPFVRSALLVTVVAGLGVHEGLAQQAVSPRIGAVSSQLAAELQSAPPVALDEFRANDAKLREFIAGKLQDERAATLARQRGLDVRPESIAAIGSFTRETLARAVFSDFLMAERAKLPPLEPLARQYYAAHLDDYQLPEAIRVAHILVAADVEVLTEDEIAERRKAADALLERVRAGEDFAALARENSDDKGSAKNGGELPSAMPRGKLVPPFEKAAWALKPGETSGLVRTRFGYHIIRLLELKPKSVKPFDDVKASLMQKVQDDILAPKRAAFVNGLRDAALEREADALLAELRAVVLKAAQVGKVAEGAGEGTATAAAVR